MSSMQGGVSLIPAQCIVLSSIPLFQRANCKCRFKELPPESRDFKLNPDKGVAAARTQTLSDFSLRLGFEFTASSQFPLSSRAGLGPSRRQPLYEGCPAVPCFPDIAIIKTPALNNPIQYEVFLDLQNYSFLKEAG